MSSTLAQVGSMFVVPGLAAAGVLAVSIPVAIHLLSRFRRQRQTWGAMRFVREAYRRHRRRLQMEQWLLLAVRCLMVAVLGLALAGPILTGCSEQLRAMGLLEGASRTVHLVIDDSLSTRARTAAGSPRFELLRESALSVVDQVGASDEVVVWGADGQVAGRSDALLSARDRAGARAAVERMGAGHGRGGMADAVAQVASALQGRGGDGLSQDVVVLISDWSRSSLDPQRAASDLAGARVVVTQRMASAGNVQLQSLRPRRRVVVAGHEGGATVSVEARVRRFEVAGDGAEAAEAQLHIELLDDAGRALTSAQRDVTLEAGQSTVTVNVDLRLSAELMRRAGGERPVVVRGSVEAGSPADNGLAEDDVRFATVGLRPTLRVGLMEDTAEAAGAGIEAGLERLSAARWMSLALSPGALGGVSEDVGPMRRVSMTAQQIGETDAARLRSLDVVVVTRPDALSSSGWTNLAAFAEAGGLVWLMVPADDPSALWARSLRRVFDVDWQLAIEPANVGSSGRGVGLRQDGPPDELSVLSPDWEGLLRPVRVERWLPLWVPAEAAWVAVDRGGEGEGGAGPGAPAAMGGASTPALLAYERRGAGGLLLLSSALDVSWTNLPTKPLFVPLVHEALRGVVGAGLTAGLVVDAAAGEAEGLEVVLPVTGEAGGADAAARSMVPGVYQRRDGEAGELVAVNVDADGGDTRAVDEAAWSAWLDGVGDWRVLDPDDPGGAFRLGDDSAPNLGWPLLWLLLGLVLLETVLARVLSHAGVEQRRGLAAAAWQRLRRFHVAQSVDQRKAA